MSTIEDQLAQAARELRREVDRHVDVDAALARTVHAELVAEPAGTEGGSRRWLGPLLVAAAVVAAVAIAGTVLPADDEEPLIAESGPSSTSTSALAPADTGIPFRLLGTVRNSGVRDGTITYAGIDDAYMDQWMSATDQPPPPVDLDREIVLTFTITEWADCPTPLIELDRDDEQVSPQLSVAGGKDCGSDVVARTSVVAIDRADLPPTFTVVLPAAPDGSYPEQSLEVALSQNAASQAPAALDGEGPVVDGPDLQAPGPGREITFDGMGEVRLGQVLDPSEVMQFDGGSSCGFWGRQEPSHDGDEPPGGLVTGADGPSPRVWTIMARRGSTYRTASGVGVGTTLATLGRIYGDRLVVDRTDQGLAPTDGLVGWYQDVAAVRYGDTALTFYLSGDVVSTVKLSPADFWGDDEGCA